MKTEQWLALGDELGVELAKVQAPGPWKHEPMKNSGICKKCGARPVIWCEGKPFYDNDSCEPPDPIVIDWNTAMEWYRKAGPQLADIYFERIWEILVERPHEKKFLGCEFMDFEMWKNECAQPKHYLIAAAMSKE